MRPICQEAMRRSRDTTEVGELLGARIREIRTKRRMSQQALAERVGIPQTHVSAIELGIQFPNLLTVLRLAVALECKVVELVGVFDKRDLESMLPK
ncbi:MAG TPA: helix-turn-helix transcriptional regulator [Thermoanaerobaculia bacterium]|nr:helix-turn-helix transcriptional regulator [Thermoanaerobaculia bacterium]